MTFIIKKKAIYIIGIGLVLVVFLATYYRSDFSNKFRLYGLYLIKGNKLNVMCGVKIDARKVSITFENDLAILEHRNPGEAIRLANKFHDSKITRITIFKKGMLQSDIPYNYGKQRLIVWYDNVQVGELYHWQTNAYHVHDYNINLKFVNGRIKLTGVIEGPDKMCNGFINYWNYGLGGIVVETPKHPSGMSHFF